MSKRLCCVNDMPGVGKVALAAMIPLCSAKGVNTFTLPTALVSNTLDYGHFEILDTTEYMENTVEVWKKLGFGFDCIATGFLVNLQQVEIVKKLVRYQAERKPLVVVDPIMGDDGTLYPGMKEDRVNAMRELSSIADILLPNYTEACYLTGTKYQSQALTQQQADQLIIDVRALGAKSVVITSAYVEGHHCVIGYDHDNNSTFSVRYDMIEVRFPGTGDIFSAVLICDMLSGDELCHAATHAAEVARNIIAENISQKDRFAGVDIERYIGEGKL